MKFSFGFSTCVFIVVLITSHKFSSSEANDVDTRHARITRLGESPIGAQYRERRSKDEDSSSNELDDGNEEENDEQSEKDADNKNDGNDDDEEEGDEEEEDDNRDELTRKQIHENLSFLRGAQNSLNIYSKGDSPLDKLVTESSDLAKEVSTVFRKIAKREAELTQEMEHLKKALDEAVINLKNTIKEEEKAKQQQSEKEAARNNEKGGGGGDDGTSENEDKEQKETQTLKRQRRNFDYNKNPYRACVSLEPIEDHEEHHVRAHYPHNQPPPTPGVSVQEYMPSRNLPAATASSYTQQQYSYQQPPVQRPPPPPAYQPHSQSRPVGEVDIKTITQTQPGGSKESRTYTQIITNSQQGSNAQRSNPQHPPARALPMTSQSLTQFQLNQQQLHQGSGQGPKNNADAVDLSEVYWLKLDPTRRQEALHNKLDTLLKRKQTAGKDVLIVPVNHGLQSTDEVRDSFLRSVRVRPKALSNKLFRKLRSLQVHIL